MLDPRLHLSAFLIDVLPFIFCIKLIPSMMQVDGSGISSAGETFLSNSLASAALFIFRKDPSAFASAHDRGPSVRSRTSTLSNKDHVAK